MTDDAPTLDEQGEDLAEGYPGLADVLTRILEADNLPERGVRRIEINLFASGEATYRYWHTDLIEPEGGYLPAG